MCVFFFSSRRRHTRYWRDWSSDVCSSDLALLLLAGYAATVVAPAVAKGTTTRSAETREYTVGGVRGHDLYAANGCVYCHSLARRDAFTDAGPGPAPSGARERLNDEPATMGQARYGQIGRAHV